jgi:hypothetical protein
MFCSIPCEYLTSFPQGVTLVLPNSSSTTLLPLKIAAKTHSLYLLLCYCSHVVGGIYFLESC